MSLSPEQLQELLDELPEPDIIRAELARRSLAKFVKLFWPVVEPDTPLIWGPHLDAVCEHLEAVVRGDLRKLLINIPPGHMKSTTVAVMLIAWWWATHPGMAGIFATHSDDLTVRDSIKCRRIIESPLYQRAYCQAQGWTLRLDQNRMDYYANSRGGVRISTSVGGGATGHHGDLIVGDDLLKANDARSKAKRDEAIEYWTKTLSSRARDQRTVRKVLMMQRLHDEDPAGFVLRAGGYEHLCLPSEYDPKRRSVTMGGKWQDWRQERGELLFSERFGAEEIANAKLDLGSDGYACQHDQLPSPAEGGMFKRDWWKHQSFAEWRQNRTIDEWAISIDAAFKDTSKSDFVVLQVYARIGASAYLRKQVRGRMDFVRTCEVIERTWKEFPEVGAILIEDKANGPAILASLRDRIPGLIAVDPGARSKEARAAAITPFVEAGNVVLPFPGQSDWVNDGWTGTRGEEPVGAFLEEMSAFPKGKNDDCVDALSQMLDRWRTSFGRSSLRIMQPPKRAERRGVDM